MNDLNTLRPEVQEALHRINRNFHISADYETIRAELLRLAAMERRLLALHEANPLTPAITDAAYCNGWNTCRKAMLDAIPEPPK